MVIILENKISYLVDVKLTMGGYEIIVYLCVLTGSIIGLIILCFYARNVLRDERIKRHEGSYNYQFKILREAKQIVIMG